MAGLAYWFRRARAALVTRSDLRGMREGTADWSARTALFAAALIILALGLHRMGSINTPSLVNIVGTGFILAALAMALAIYAGGVIWIRGHSGAWPAAIGFLLGAMIFAWPLALYPRFAQFPAISDISTNLVDPPSFQVLAAERTYRDNGPRYQLINADKQRAAYPDVRTLVVERSIEDMHDIIVDLVGGRRGMRWQIVSSVPPELSPPRPGIVEANEKSLIIGFVDDIIIRIGGDEKTTRIDMRSASRYGTHDFGANAARIRRFLRELISRLELMEQTGGRVPRRPGTRPRPGQEDDGSARAGAVSETSERTPGRAATRRELDRAQRETLRAPIRRERPRE